MAITDKDGRAVNITGVKVLNTRRRSVVSGTYSDGSQALLTLGDLKDAQEGVEIRAKLAELLKPPPDRLSPCIWCDTKTPCGKFAKAVICLNCQEKR